jgi:hypothetical protein
LAVVTTVIPEAIVAGAEGVPAASSIGAQIFVQGAPDGVGVEAVQATLLGVSSLK